VDPAILLFEVHFQVKSQIYWTRTFAAVLMRHQQKCRTLKTWQLTNVMDPQSLPQNGVKGADFQPMVSPKSQRTSSQFILSAPLVGQERNHETKTETNKAEADSD